jgi:hypothetical protein
MEAWNIPQVSGSAVTSPNAPLNPLSPLDQLEMLEEIILDSPRVPFTGGRLVKEQDAMEALDALRESLNGRTSRAEE